MQIRRFTLALVVLGAAFGFVSCGDDHDNDIKSVPTAVDTAFQAQYPNGTNTHWETKGAYYVANFRSKGGMVETEAWYTAAGKWAMTEYEFGRDLMYLPAAVSAEFARSEYATWVVDDIDVYEYPNASRNMYVIEVDKPGQQDVDLYFGITDGKAQLLKTAIHRDIDVTPDTQL